MSICFRCAQKLHTLNFTVFRTVSSTAALRCDKPPTSGTEADDREEYDAEAEDEARQVLQMSLQFVPKHGWSREALIAGAEASGLPGVGHGMFPRGGIELVNFFYEECNSDLVTQMIAEKEAEKEEGTTKRKTSRFIRDAVVTRLSMNQPYVENETWPQAMALRALPQNALQSWSNLGRLMDDIWHHAGDDSARFDWYTKRLSLAAVYKSTEFFMLQDRSEDMIDTWTFLDRRMKDVKAVGQGVGNAQQAGDLLCDGLWSAGLTLQNVLGLNYRRR